MKAVTTTASWKTKKEVEEYLTASGWYKISNFFDDYMHATPPAREYRRVIKKIGRKWTIEIHSTCRNGYNYVKDSCDRCHVTKAERDLKPAMPTGSANFNYASTKSFSLGTDGSVLCPECHKEHKLESLFALMDAREKRGLVT